MFVKHNYKHFIINVKEEGEVGTKERKNERTIERGSGR